MAISELLTDPDSFFEQEVEDPSMLVPTVLVLVAALLAAVAASPRAQLIGEIGSMALESQGAQFNQSVQNMAAAGAKVFTVGIAFVVVLLGWLVYSVVFYAISHLGFDGDGSFTHTIFLTGWGYLPAVINQAVAAVVAYTVFSGVTLPETHQAADQKMTALQSDPLLLAAGVVGLVLLVWSGVIWTYAMEHLHDISRRDAAITVGIPVAIVLLMRINGIV